MLCRSSEESVRCLCVCVDLLNRVLRCLCVCVDLLKRVLRCFVCCADLLKRVLRCLCVSLSSSEEHLGAAAGSGSCGLSQLQSAVCHEEDRPLEAVFVLPAARRCRRLPLQRQDRRAGDCCGGAGQTERESKQQRCCVLSQT